MPLGLRNCDSSVRLRRRLGGVEEGGNGQVDEQKQSRQSEKRKALAAVCPDESQGQRGTERGGVRGYRRFGDAFLRGSLGDVRIRIPPVESDQRQRPGRSLLRAQKEKGFLVFDDDKETESRLLKNADGNDEKEKVGGSRR